MTEPAVVYRERLNYSGRRRVLDLAIAGAVSFIAAPIVGLAALAIVIEDGLPVFFVQKRIGRFGRPFRIYKLRTMRKNGGDALKPKSGRDPRITRVGRVLRRLSIDELPQFYNVLRGDMAVVGPRPEMPFVVDRYERWQHLRSLVPPGITGLWQITVRSTVPLEKPEATLIDLDYVQRASTGFDVKLVLRTFLSVIFPRGAF